jgi:hypothetical protein
MRRNGQAGLFFVAVSRRGAPGDCPGPAALPESLLLVGDIDSRPTKD